MRAFKPASGFAVSRLQKTSGNDADRLRKYLMRFDLSFEDIARK